MNILVVALNFSPEIVGCAKFTSEFVNWFSKKTNRVIVITTNPFYPQWKCEINRYNKALKGNILIIRCPIYIPKKVNGLNRIIHYLSFSISSMPLILYFGLKDIDLAFTMCPTILSAPNLLLISFLKKIFLKKKLVTWIHFADLEIEAAFKLNFLKSKLLKKLLLIFEKNILKSFDLISSISFYMLERIKQITKKDSNIFYLPDFIDTDKFNNIYKNVKVNPYYKKLSLKKESIVVMYSGTLNDKLSYITLINSIRTLRYKKELVWIICGEGPKKEYLKQSLKDHKNVLFHDFQPLSKLPYWLDLADIHLIPQKLSSVEFCLPSKLLGILAIGKPVIGIAPKFSELGKILDKYGIRLSSEKSEEMSEAIIKLINNKELRFKISRKSKNYIEKFHEKENILNNMFSEVKRIISKG